MPSTSVYSLKRPVLEGAGAKALATDHREVAYHDLMLNRIKVLWRRLNRARKTFNESTLHGFSHHIINIKLKIWLSDINNVVRK